MSARSDANCTSFKRSCLPALSRKCSNSKLRSKWSSSARLLRPVTIRTSVSPARAASSTTYWIAGLSTTGSISFGVAFVKGRNRVPRPAAGITALVTAMKATLVRRGLRGGGGRQSPGVAPCVLRLVERLVRATQQRRRASPVRREDSRADRHGHLDLALARITERSAPYGVADALGCLHRTLDIGLRQDHHDLLAAVPRHGVDVTHLTT